MSTYNSLRLITRNHLGTIWWRAPPYRLLCTASPDAVQPFSEIPGPRGVPILGNIWGAYRGGVLRGKLHEHMHRQHQRYGPIYKEKLGPGFESVFLNDPNDVQHLYRNEDQYPSRSKFTHWLQYREEAGEEPGVLLGEDTVWHDMRRSVNSHMMRPRAVGGHTEEINLVMDDALAVVDKHIQPQSRLITNMDHLLFNISLEAASMVMFEKRLGNLDGSSTIGQELINAVKHILEGSLALLVFSPKVASKLHLPMWTNHKKAWDQVFRIGHLFVGEAIAKARASLDDENEQGGLVASMIKTGLLTDNQIVSCVLELMMGSIDTTASTILWTLSDLSRYPEKQNKLLQELSSVIPQDGRIQREHIDQLHYLKACVRESLRLHPVSPVVSREMHKDIVLHGYNIPKESTIIVSLTVQRWDENEFRSPNDYIPERWLRESKEKSHSFAMLNFGHGVRSCVGRRLAELEIQLFISRLLQKYHIGCEDQNPPEEISPFLLIPAKKIPFTLTPRS